MAFPDARGTVIIARGELDAFTSAPLKEALMVAWRDEDDDVVLDLSDVTFLDAAIAELIPEAAQLMSAAGRVIIMRGLSSAQKRTLTLCQVSELLAFE